MLQESMSLKAADISKNEGKTENDFISRFQTLNALMSSFTHIVKPCRTTGFRTQC
jgi:hypothetical protein